MSLSPKEAAEAVGRSRQAILKAVKDGRISATKGQDGTWRIEPVELFRVYEPVTRLPATDTPQVVTGIQAVAPELQAENTMLKALNERLADEVSDLRKRLDQEGQERRQLLARLTDDRPWWRRLLG